MLNDSSMIPVFRAAIKGGRLEIRGAQFPYTRIPSFSTFQAYNRLSRVFKATPVYLGHSMEKEENKNSRL